MAVVLLAFGSMLFGCDVTQGEMEMGKVDMEQTPISVSIGDSIAVPTIIEGITLGAVPKRDTIRKSKCTSEAKFLEI